MNLLLAAIARQHRRIGYNAVPTIVGLFTGPLYDGVPFSQSLPVVGGTGGYNTPTVLTGALPSGLALSIVGSNVVLSGTCYAGATSTFTLQVLDSASNAGASNLQSLTRQDQYFSMVKALLHFDGANGGPIVDQIAGHTWAATSPAALDTTVGTRKYGTAALNCNAASGGTGGISSTHADYGLGTGDFCVEGWCYLPALPGGSNSCLWQQYDGVSKFISAYNDLSFSQYLWVNTDLIGPTATFPTGPIFSRYTYWAVCRHSGQLNASVDGVVTAIGACTEDFTAATLMAVGKATGAGQGAAGFVDDFRLTVGTSRGYESTFTPPVDAHPDS